MIELKFLTLFYQKKSFFLPYFIENISPTTENKQMRNAQLSLISLVGKSSGCFTVFQVNIAQSCFSLREPIRIVIKEIL